MILNTKDGKRINAEIITSFKLEQYEDEYVIYKVNNDYYGAKYLNENNISKLDTNLNENEKKILIEFFQKLKEEGVINA